MIIFALACASGHHFEGWFGSTSDFSTQQESGLIVCPDCGSSDVAKAPSAPRLARKGNQQAVTFDEKSQPVTSAKLPPEAVKMIAALAKAQAAALKNSRWVGDKFADQSRAIHYGEQDHETIHGQTTRDEAEALIDEGISVAPLLFPVAPPESVN